MLFNDTLLQDYITATVQQQLNKEIPMNCSLRQDNILLHPNRKCDNCQYCNPEVDLTKTPTMIIEHDFPEDNKIIVFCPCGGTFEGEQGDVDFCPKCGSTINID